MHKLIYPQRDDMTKLDILDRGIIELRKLQDNCWQDLASNRLTLPERRETRIRMIAAASDLRRCLDAYEAEARRLREEAALERRSARSVQLRFLSTDYRLIESVG